jgi:dTDP-glucose 4,6-dehydratase
VPRAVVTGGAGFLGSHMCERLLDEGWDVLCLDSFLTGDASNLDTAKARPGFELRNADVSEELVVDGDVDAVLHMASPASPVDYGRFPIETLRVGAIGTHRALDLARGSGARFLLTSTSEVYGDPRVHPQPETYWGNVNPIGPRSVYDEAKRFAEAITFAYYRTFDLPVRVARIFNTYGPRMRPNDGRAVPTFLRQALSDEPITVHGDGTQTRSLCFVDDLVDGLWRMLGSESTGPINLGNPEEVTMLELAERIRDLVGSSSEIVFTERPADDPGVRRPTIDLATSELGWRPRVPLSEGLARTVDWGRRVWRET